jgi:hypothetical protein
MYVRVIYGWEFTLANSRTMELMESKWKYFQFFLHEFFLWFQTKSSSVLISGVNFINVLRTAFVLVEILKAWELSQVISIFFTLLGSASIKVVRRTLMKLSPGVNFINVLFARFWYEILFSSYVLALKELLYKKHVRKTLVKFTSAFNKSKKNFEMGKFEKIERGSSR